MEDELKINEIRKRIEEKMKELEVLDYHSLLIFASTAALNLEEKGLNEKFPEGFDYEEYAAKMLIKGAELSKIYYSKKANEARLAKDPKQMEKTFVKECWLDWSNGVTNYKGKAAFARDMLDKCKHLISQKKIEDWCRMWEKESLS